MSAQRGVYSPEELARLSKTIGDGRLGKVVTRLLRTALHLQGQATAPATVEVAT